MGQSQSTRKLTISNQDEIRTIEVSNALVEKFIKEDASTGTIQHQNTKEEIFPILESRSNVVPNDLNSAYTISALQIQQKLQNDLKAQETHWRLKFQELKKRHESIEQNIKQEYNKALARVSNSKVSGTQNSLKPCIDCSKQILKCYRDHSSDILNCAGLVNQFMECVGDQRKQLMKF